MHTRILGPDGWLCFQEYFVREKTQVEVRAVEYGGAGEARPAPGLIEAIGGAEAVLVCPSNPITSIGPILAVPGIVAALEGTGAPVLAVSPIVGGRAVSGPAGRLMAARGLPVSAVGIAQAYAPWLDFLVMDDEDVALGPSVQATGARPVVASTLMTGRVEEMRLARRILEALG